MTRGSGLLSKKSTQGKTYQKRSLLFAVKLIHQVEPMENLNPNLTPKQQAVIAAFEHARPGFGAIALLSIMNPNSGWSEIIADMPESEIKPGTGTASNSFSYRRIGGA
jgi:hypothetical protein